MFSNYKSSSTQICLSSRLPITGETFILAENPFPYHLERSIRHFVVFSLKNKLSFQEAGAIVERVFPKVNHHVLLFSNGTNGSVKSIPHVQVFISRKFH